MRRDPVCHILKTKPEFFDAVTRGDKTLEMRKDDRDFTDGDYLLLVRLNEQPTGWRPKRNLSYNKNPGKSALVKVTHILRGEYVLEGYAALSIKLLHHDS